MARFRVVASSVVEQHHFNAALALCENFDADPATAPYLKYTKPTFWKQTKDNLKVGAMFSSDICTIKMVINVNGKSNKRLLQLGTFLITRLCWTFGLTTAPAPAPAALCRSDSAALVASHNCQDESESSERRTVMSTIVLSLQYRGVKYQYHWLFCVI
jgi:hypothetical protein